MSSYSADSAHPRYPASPIVLHWLTFTLVVCVYALAELKGYGARQPPAQRDATPALSDWVVDIRVDVVAVHFAHASRLANASSGGLSQPFSAMYPLATSTLPNPPENEYK